MLKSVEGVYRNGKIELVETPDDVGEARVIVTFLPKDGPIDLRALGISEAQAAEMRWSYRTMIEDWNRPEMDVYDDM